MFVVYEIKCPQLRRLTSISIQFLCIIAVKMFPCTVCDVKLNSAEQMRAHCRGKNHIKREEARKKAQELGTDFDSTPDHCDVCNVPLTSKMTAIDHFKGKMHQKKVKALEEQRKGFKNYCEICEVRLQSLKVSEAHFKGKQHNKRERKTNSGKGQGKKIPIDRKYSYSRSSRPRTEDFSPTQNIFGVGFEETPKNSSSWENLNCDSDIEPKDLLSEFRNFISGKPPSSTDTSKSSSPETSTEPFFSFDIPVVSHSSAINTSPKRQPTVISNGLTPFVNGDDFSQVIENTAFGGLWQTQKSYHHLNETCKPTLHFPSTESHFICTQNEVLRRTQAVVFVLEEAGQGISSGDIATKIPELSPTDVNLILSDLEKCHLVSKSGYAPILWSLVGSIRYSPSSPSKPHNIFNGFSEKMQLPKDTQSFESSKESNSNENAQNNFPTADVLEASENVRPYAHVIESNLVNLFQKVGSLSEQEIKAELNFRGEARLRFMLEKLLERNVIVKGDDQRWRLANSTRNNVGVIGEERKRRSPVRDRTPTPPNENSHEIPDSYHTTTASFISNGFQTATSPPKENSQRILNGYSRSPQTENIHDVQIPNSFHTFEFCSPKDGYLETGKCNGTWQDASNVGTDSHYGNNKRKQNRSLPPVVLKTEASEVLDDLTFTTPKSYQKELYEMAMQEDTVCYIPCGTGKSLVVAQVIAHMAILNPTKQALVIVHDVVSALTVAQVLRKELGSNSKRKKLNVALHAGQLKQSIGKVHVVVATSSTCLGLLNCGALSWNDVSLLIFDDAMMCCNDEASKEILHEYYLKAKMRDGSVPKLLSFIDSSAGQENMEETVRTLGNILSVVGDVFLSCITKSLKESEQDKREAMFVCVQTCPSEEESRMFYLLEYYLNLVFDNLTAQWQPMNNYAELLKISFQGNSVISDPFVKLIHLTGQPLMKRLPVSCLKTWRHYLAICEVILALAECGEDLAKELLLNLTHEEFGFTWANDVGLPSCELYRQLMDNKVPNWGASLSDPRGSGLRELLEQLTIMQWENARVSSERPLALVLVKLNKTAKVLANYLAQCPQLTRRNVKTTFVDGSRPHQQKAVMSAIKRHQYQVIVSTDNIKQDVELPQCELVVLLDQPTSVNLLEQLRTRRATNVVAICRDGDSENDLKKLLRQEELVEKAITCIRADTT